jgi:hypothetical protein
VSLTAAATLTDVVRVQIERCGTVLHVDADAGGCGLTIADSAPILDDCHIGDSVAVNGACLTVTAFDKDQSEGWFKVWLANETLDRTNLGAFFRHPSSTGRRSFAGECQVGDQVNLERAMAPHARFGGHFVQVRHDTMCPDDGLLTSSRRLTSMGRRLSQRSSPTATLFVCASNSQNQRPNDLRSFPI